MRHTVQIVINCDMDVTDIDAAREVIVASLGDLGEHAEITITPDKLHEAERLLKDGASYNEVERTLNIAHKTLKKYFPGYGWTKAQGAQWRDLKDQMESAQLWQTKKARPAGFCKKGLHRLEGENVGAEASGKRRCLACRRQWAAERYAKKR